MEMMQKMMAQMSESGKPLSMDKIMSMCMGMCGEMLSTIKQTNALAVQATPELQKALGLLAKETADGAALASSLRISEESALYLLNRLAASGKITLTGKAKAKGDGSSSADWWPPFMCFPIYPIVFMVLGLVVRDDGRSRTLALEPA
jgi:hypothetical protein